MPIFGVVGIIQLDGGTMTQYTKLKIKGKYLMAIKDRSLAGFYGSQPVYRIEEVWITSLHDMDSLHSMTVYFCCHMQS